MLHLLGQRERRGHGGSVRSGRVVRRRGGIRHEAVTCEAIDELDEPAQRALCACRERTLRQFGQRGLPQ